MTWHLASVRAILVLPAPMRTDSGKGVVKSGFHLFGGRLWHYLVSHRVQMMT